ncbi:hypothetical protein JZ751_014862 [Albula glossodonta]|uniref:Uncharacterized protein n=1 Tax=Albula glossodonta TaxID=121402 RepID=A0A8T2MYE9_9TELE|nr:hypothetical protein JZ751_014862 [Albula glossodonta]
MIDKETFIQPIRGDGGKLAEISLLPLVSCVPLRSASRLIEQRVTDSPRGCWPISSLPRAQWVSPHAYWLQRVWERMQRRFHTNSEFASQL